MRNSPNNPVLTRANSPPPPRSLISSASFSSSPASHLSTSSSAEDEQIEQEEDEDLLGSLPSKEGLDKHTVFRTPSFDSSDLANRLAQLSVSNLTSRPKTLARQPSIGAGGPGISGEGVIDEEGITDEEKMEAIVEEFGPIEVGRGEPGESSLEFGPTWEKGEQS